MLDENPVNQQAICDALIYVHRTGAIPTGVTTPAGFTVVKGLVTIAYGYNGTQYGSIQITRGQFALTGVTNATGTMVALNSYNHSGSSITLQDYINALKCNNLNSNQAYVSALIILTSESCRSAMVCGAMQAILANHNNFSPDVWAGLSFAFNTYSQTAKFRGYDINAGGSPWTWLKADDYIAYINSSGYTGDKTVVTKIAAVKAYK
ncbi:MAG TPA: hypothetical protein VNZ86_19680 [Bacteroidia bacterium]|jgi:hypothetical protein|nr:hypothetical protein [Bacteroidia bacterium]